MILSFEFPNANDGPKKSPAKGPDDFESLGPHVERLTKRRPPRPRGRGGAVRASYQPKPDFKARNVSDPENFCCSDCTASGAGVGAVCGADCDEESKELPS